VSALEHLRALVGFDTRNPPRDISASHPIVGYLVEHLPGFDVEVEDLGQGCVWVYATRGPVAEATLINCHVDTVPAAGTWVRDPLELLVEGGRAVGLGACDIKGAAACMLAAAARTTGPAALLFTSDEEAGSSACVKAFTDRHAGVHREVVVCEPTRCEAVLAHRGIVTCAGEFDGTPGHASHPRALTDSAVHAATRWAFAAQEDAAAELARTADLELPGVSFNLGRIEGGMKPNMIADACHVRWGVRPSPRDEPEALLARLCGHAEAGRVEWTRGFFGPTLPAPRDGAPGAARLEESRRFAARLGVDVGEAVDFWTEAALFSEAGMTALVCGPGDIAQAHAGGEWVALEQLERAERVYARVMSAVTSVVASGEQTVE
jgi:acetylornithine deacetylase